MAARTTVRVGVCLSMLGGAVVGSPLTASAASMCDGRVATIVDTTGDDTVTGTPGDDVIVSKYGNDTISAGGGNDRICIGGRTNRTIGIDGGSGTDSVVMLAYGAQRLITFDLPNNTWAMTNGVDPGDTKGTIASIERLVAYGAQVADLPGSLTYELAFGSIGSRGGNDTILRLAGPVGVQPLYAHLTVNYGGAPKGVKADLVAGTTTVVGWTSDVTRGAISVTGTPFADSFRGTDGNEEFDGGYGADIVDGGGGDDYLVALGGRATIAGGTGDDYIVPGAGFATRVDGGGGTNDVIALFKLTSAVTADLRTQTVVHAGGTFHMTGFEGLVGTVQSDTLIGTNAANKIWGRQGTDTIRGLGGNDELYGEYDNDIVDGGSGTDSCFGIILTLVTFTRCETIAEWGD